MCSPTYLVELGDIIEVFVRINSTGRGRIADAWVVEEDGATKILFGVIGLIRCCRAFDRQSDVFLRFKLGGVNGLGIQVKRGCYFSVAQKPLNRLYVLTPADQKRRKAMTKVVEYESLPRLQSNASL